MFMSLQLIEFCHLPRAEPMDNLCPKCCLSNTFPRVCGIALHLIEKHAAGYILTRCQKEAMQQVDVDFVYQSVYEITNNCLLKLL